MMATTFELKFITEVALNIRTLYFMEYTVINTEKVLEGFATNVGVESYTKKIETDEPLGETTRFKVLLPARKARIACSDIHMEDPTSSNF